MSEPKKNYNIDAISFNVDADKQISFATDKSITLTSGTGIYFGDSASSVNKVTLNNIYLNGKIDLRNLELMGSMNTRMQTSIFNQLNEEMINSKNSKATCDQYGPVYGPVYGDILGTINSKGSLIGGDNGGYIGSTYTEVYESSLSKEFNPESIINLNDFDTLESIPMNITKIDANLKNFSVSSYNTRSSQLFPDYIDPYFGNLYNLTLDGKDDFNNSFANVLYSDKISSSITFESKNLDIKGNVKLFNSITYDFKDVDVKNIDYTSAELLYVSGNVKINGDYILNSNGNLKITTINTTNPNLSGNFRFNYTPITGIQFEINGNIVRNSDNLQNRVVWDEFNSVKELGNANITFPKSIDNVSRFSNTGNGNIIVYGSTVMINSNVYYNNLNLYGNLIANLYSRMAIYSNIEGTMRKIDETNKNNATNPIIPKNYNGSLLNIGSIQNNIFYYGNQTIVNYINSLSNDATNDNKTLLSKIDTWVRYIKPGFNVYWPHWPSAFGFTNNFTLNDYNGHSNNIIKNKAWYIHGSASINGSQTINGAERWYLQSGVDNNAINVADNIYVDNGLRDNEATYLFLGPFSIPFDIETTFSFDTSGYAESNWDGLTVCYHDYNPLFFTEQDIKQQLCNNIKPQNSSTSHWNSITDNNLNNIIYLTTYSISQTTYDNTLSVYQSKSYNLPILQSGLNRMIIIMYSKDYSVTFIPDVFRITNFKIAPVSSDPIKYLYTDYGWNFKDKTELQMTFQGISTFSGDNLYLSTGNNNLEIRPYTSSYFLIGPVSYRDFDIKYLYNVFFEFEYATKNYDNSTTIELYKVENNNIINESNFITNIFTDLPTNIIKTFTYNTNGTNYSCNKELRVYDTLKDTKYKYYYFKIKTTSKSAGITFFNIQFRQYPQDDIIILYKDIITDPLNKLIIANIYSSLIDNFYINYKFNRSTILNLTENNNLLIISGKFVQDPLLSFNAILSNVNHIIKGNIFINGNSTFNQTELSGTFLNGNLQDGKYVFNNMLNYYNKIYYNYTWHSNLKYLSTTKLDDIAEQNPFDGLIYKNIMLCGQMGIYNIDKTYTSTPLHDDQLSILEYTFKPDKKNFTINFKYQIFSEFRGDYFYFQYSIDNGRTYYNLLKQSGDINDIKSVALIDKYRWKNASFYLPYNPIYIFRWVYKKDSTLSSGYDTVFLADIFINYLNPVIQKINNELNIYANNFIGNISTTGTTNTQVKDYKISFKKKNENPIYGYVNGDILINGTMENYINSSINANSNLIYANMETYYRNTTNYMNKEFLTYKIFSNTDLNVNKSWRLYNYNELKNKISSWNWNALQYDATTDFINNNELALMSSESKMSFLYNMSMSDQGLGPNDAAIFTIGPINYGDLIENEHQLQFKYFKDSNENSDIGIITYDYTDVSNHNDTIIEGLLTKIVDLYNLSNHYLLNDLIDKYDINKILNKNDIISYPDNQSGFTSVQSFKYGWNDISINLNKIPTGKKRIIVFFYSKDTYTSYGYDDVVLIHDIKLTFKKEGASFKFTGFTNKTGTNQTNNINKNDYEYLNIDTPSGKRFIQLYVDPTTT